MKRLITIYSAMAASAILMFGLASCNKSSDALSDKTPTTSTSALALANGDILIAASNSSSLFAATKDSVFLMRACTPGKRPDSIAFSALSTTITDYLTNNYAGYTFKKAFKVTDRSGVTVGYVVAITFNSKPVGLKFDANSAFVSVLEQRERDDHQGKGWHPGGRFENRNGLHGDTIAISALPAAIKSYFTTNYATDTLVHAVITKDTSYIVFSANKGLFATSFSSKLTFVKRVQLYPRPMRAPVLASALPATIANYLTNTYSGYVFDKAFAEKVNGVVTKYVVLIDASGTRYAVQFAGAGTFVKAITIK